MPICNECGTSVEEGKRFCPACGTEMPDRAAQQGTGFGQQAAGFGGGYGGAAQQGTGNSFEEKLKNLNNTADTTYEFSADDVQKNKGMAILAYIGILVLIPLFAAKDSKFARYHTNQGLVLLIVNIAYGILSGVIGALFGRLFFPLTMIPGIFRLLSLAILALMVLGIVNAAKGLAKELPIIGRYKVLK